MDLPAGVCSIELHMRDADGQVVCSHDDGFLVGGAAPQVNIFLVCPREPAESLNICPDLGSVECAGFEEAESTTSCKPIFRDEDGTCTDGCDPTTCVPSETGLTCMPGPDPGVSARVTCGENVLDCQGDGMLDASCIFLDSGGSFTIDCAPTDGIDHSGFSVACTVVVTDGDMDCDVREVVSVACPDAPM
ncbi:MAG: hypothetical protein WBG86_06535 [Polyangiales bacterium]